MRKNITNQENRVSLVAGMLYDEKIRHNLIKDNSKKHWSTSYADWNFTGTFFFEKELLPEL